MNVVAFNGSPRAKGNTAILLNLALDQLKNDGIETELISLAGKTLPGCIACFKCFERKDGHCAVTGDMVNDCIDKMRAADGILLGSPTYFSDVSAGMKALIERAGMTSRANPEILRRKVGAGVVAVRRAGAMHAFTTLNLFFLIGEMIVVGSSYWNIGIGREPGEVENDAEGVSTMKTLGRNMAWLLKRIAADEKEERHMISHDELRQIKLFQSVDLKSITGLIDACTIRMLAAGEELITAGQVNRTIYFIISGIVRVHRNPATGTPATILGPGESIAEMSVIDRRPAPASVVAVEPSRLLAMDEDILWSLVRTSHAAACNLLIALTARLRQPSAVSAENPEAEEGYGTFDILTGLPNRVWLERILKRQIERAGKGSEPQQLAVIMVDIDDFKTFNNRHGVAYGDHFLSFVSHKICDRLRPTEVITRYGGDEFVIFLPGIDLDVARRISERIHRGVMDAVPVMPDGTTIPHPTISLGLAMLRPGQTAEDLLAEADRALTRAKDGGGNSIAE